MVLRICSPQLGLSPNSILGGEIYDREILKQLAHRGNQIEIILPWGKPHDRVANWHITNVPLPFIVPPHLYNVLVLPYLFSLYKSKSFDILRIHSPTFIGVAAEIFKFRYPQVPVIGVYHWLGEGGWVGDYLNPRLIQKFDGIICDSQTTRKQIISDFHKSPDCVFAIHNGVDPSLKPNAKTIPHKMNFRLLFMGLFIERKNPLFLVRLMPKMIKLIPNCELILCGNGKQKQVLEAETVKLKLKEHIKIIPPVFGEIKQKLFHSADVFVHPALNEGFSLAVIEAMACGLPIIITDKFSAREAVINGKNGFLCRKENDWLKSIQLLYLNETLHQQIKKVNVLKVKTDFNWRSAAAKHELVFNFLLTQIKKRK
jgi:glycosyltransferase involved in cell wall biosynthesis